MFNIFNTLFQGYKLQWECTCFHCLLYFAHPLNWCSVYKQELTIVWYPCHFVCSVGRINKWWFHQWSSSWSWHLMFHLFLCVSIVFFELWWIIFVYRIIQPLAKPYPYTRSVLVFHPKRQICEGYLPCALLSVKPGTVKVLIPQVSAQVFNIFNTLFQGFKLRW